MITELIWLQYGRGKGRHRFALIYGTDSGLMDDAATSLARVADAGLRFRSTQISSALKGPPRGAASLPNG